MKNLIKRVALAILFTLCRQSPAIIFFATANPDFNTTPPTGPLAGAGWDLQGQWGTVLATPIAPSYFIAARHTAGQIGDKIIFDGRAFATVGFFDSPESDLRVWKISGAFPRFARLYEKSDESGKSAVVFGRGAERGSEVRVGGLLGSELKGWVWGSAGSRQRWGENQVSRILSTSETGAGMGDLLRFDFNANGGANEAHVSGGDSGGGVFVRDTDGWKLAGLVFAVEGPYSTSLSGPEFSAAVFDEGGLYKRRVYIPETPFDQPGAFYATRISSNLEWIRGVLASAEPAMILFSSSSVTGPYAIETKALIDSARSSIVLPIPASNRFFILQDSVARRLRIQIENGNLLMNYE
jgi:hypothetical protein